MAKILHTGDLHLDSAFSGLTGERAALRRERQRELVSEIVELANRENVDILLLAGDLFDGKNAYYETAAALRRILAGCRCRVFIAPGNHDAYHSMSPYRSVEFSENVHLFSGRGIESVDIPELNICVHGAGFTDNSCDSSMLRNFRAPDDSRTHIMLMHGVVTEGASSYNPIREADIRDSNLSYLALGHVHSFGGVQYAGDTAYVYCGCPEGRGFDECGEKGVLIGEVDEHGVRMEFRGMSKYRYYDLKLRLAPDEDVRGALAAMLPESDEFGLYRVELSGDHERVDTALLTKELCEGLCFLEIVDRTAPLRPIWEGEEQDSLRGAFLRSLHERYLATGDVQEQEMLKLAARFGIAALDNMEEPR